MSTIRWIFDADPQSPPKPNNSDVGVCAAALARIRHMPGTAQKVLLLHASCGFQEPKSDQCVLKEKKQETRGESHNHAPQYGINTLSGKATMMKKKAPLL